MVLEKKDTRTLDELGRILIPQEIRIKLGWDKDVTLTLQCTENNTLTIKAADKKLKK